MGTQYHISLVLQANQHINIDKLKVQIDMLLLEINQQMSTYIPTSEISRFNQYKQKNWFPVSNDFAQVVSTAQRVSKQSNGAFDITVAPLIDLWGFGATTQFTMPTKQQIKGVLQHTGYQLLEVRASPPALRKLNPNLHIDLSAIAKGFAVDKIWTFLNQKNYSDFLVEIGGEVRNRGLNQKNEYWKIGIETPKKNGFRVSQALLTSNLAIATSGDYRNYFIKDGARYSHTINPKTGKPIRHKLASITVLQKSTMMADAYATALMVLGDEKGKVFANTNKIRVNMIIRNNSNLQVWKNFDATKLLH
jgi:thiamine biosynthesis lipoprotein